jgi:hypothetical protein
MGRARLLDCSGLITMDDLFERAYVLLEAYLKRHDPLDVEVDASIVLGLTNKSSVILMRQIMFALAFQEFGGGNQEAFFRFIIKYNKIAPDGKHLGPKKFSSIKSLRPYLKKARKHIQPMSGKILANYMEFAFPLEAVGVPTFSDFIWNS